MEEIDAEQSMSRAFELSKAALSAGEVPVGCVIAGPHAGAKSVLLSEGRNEVNLTHNATRHAELVALDKLGELCKENNINLTELLCKSTLYVTVEPCIMCASALLQVKLGKLVFGCRNPRFGGFGSVIDVRTNCTESCELEIEEGVRKEEAVGLLKEFYKRENPFAPQESRLTKNDR